MIFIKKCSPLEEFFLFCVPTRHFFSKKLTKKFVRKKKKLYFCKRYPENNLFTLKKD